MLAGERVLLGVIHQAGVGARRGREDLHLLRQYAQFLAGKALERKHIFLCAARVSRDEVIGQELLFAGSFAQRIKALLESQQALHTGLAHAPQHRRLGMLRRQFKLP